MIRPLSALNIRSNKLSNLKNNYKYEENKIIFNDRNQVDLDLLFEKQLKKLREINKEYKSNDEINEIKNNINYDINNNNKLNLNKTKRNENNYDINYNNEKNILFFDNINKNKTLDNRPSSHCLKKNHSLPRISSPKYNNRTVFRQEENIFNYKNNLSQKYNKSKIKKLSPTSSSIKTLLHKDFGKIPKYIQELKIKAEILKEIQNKKKEEEQYPKGTRLISEEERLLTLRKLIESKKEIENLIEKLPITLNSLTSRNKQQKLYKELDEIEQAIIIFSKKQVFVKIDS